MILTVPIHFVELTRKLPENTYEKVMDFINEFPESLKDPRRSFEKMDGTAMSKMYKIKFDYAYRGILIKRETGYHLLDVERRSVVYDKWRRKIANFDQILTGDSITEKQEIEDGDSVNESINFYPWEVDYLKEIETPTTIETKGANHPIAVLSLEDEARQGDADSQYLLAYSYCIGEEFEQDLKKAAYWFNRAATLEQIEAQHILGLMYLAGIGVKKSIKSGISWLKKAAEAKDVDSMNNLAACYQEGYGVKKDVDQALYWLQEAVKLGGAAAMNNLATLYQKGIHVEIDEEKALELYQQAAAKGFLPAKVNLACFYHLSLGGDDNLQKATTLYLEVIEDVEDKPEYLDVYEELIAITKNNLGTCYHAGRGVEKDLEMAFHLYVEASELGSKIAQWEAAMCYLDSIGTAPNFQKAIFWLKKAATQNHAKAQNLLGQFHIEGFHVEKNPYAAFQLFRQAAQAGYAEAQFHLGYCFGNSIGCHQDINQAFQWYEKAATQGHGDAIHNVGFAYHMGEGVKKDTKAALNWYEKADSNRRGGESTLLMMGQLYEYELLDLPKALSCYKEAAERGFFEAQFHLGRCCYEGIGSEQNFEEAFTWFKQAAAQGDPMSQSMLGECYLKGRGVEENHQAAFESFMLAAKQGFPKAQYLVSHCYREGIGTLKNIQTSQQWKKKALIGGYSQRQFDQEFENSKVTSVLETNTSPGQKTPSRNQPCPCGSNKKYKKCCALENVN